MNSTTELSEAGLGGFIFDVVSGFFFWLLPDSIAGEAQWIFIGAVVAFIVYSRIRGSIQRRRLARAVSTGDYAGVAVGSNPFGGNAAPSVPAEGSNPFGGDRTA
jgi:hypothetical protein